MIPIPIVTMDDKGPTSFVLYDSRADKPLATVSGQRRGWVAEEVCELLGGMVANEEGI